MLALIEQQEFDLDSQETVFAVSTKNKEIVQISISKLYSTAVADPIYRPEQRTAIQEEIAFLQANNIQVEEKVPKSTNLVSTKQIFTVKL